jgi:sortase A
MIRGSRGLRRLAFGLIAVGVLALAWSAVTLQWGEPVTGMIHRAQVRGLVRQLEAETDRAASRARSRAPRVPGLRDGAPVGRLTGRGVDAIVVMGKSSGDLRKGPGLWNVRPGYGRTTVISGHRTTYGAPFRHIDRLRRADRLRLVTPYGTFTYAVIQTRIVKPSDRSVIRDVGHEQLVLTSCHPVYSAARRIVVFADRIRPSTLQRAASRSAPPRSSARG